MKKILGEIQSGQFAKELVEEFAGGQVNHLKYREELGGHPIEVTGAKLRPMFSWLND
jgi:ketol-acid reductoisomerase